MSISLDFQLWTDLSVSFKKIIYTYVIVMYAYICYGVQIAKSTHQWVKLLASDWSKKTREKWTCQNVETSTNAHTHWLRVPFKLWYKHHTWKNWEWTDQRAGNLWDNLKVTRLPMQEMIQVDKDHLPVWLTQDIVQDLESVDLRFCKQQQLCWMLSRARIPDNILHRLWWLLNRARLAGRIIVLKHLWVNYQ